MYPRQIILEENIRKKSQMQQPPHIIVRLFCNGWFSIHSCVERHHRLFAPAPTIPNSLDAHRPLLLLPRSTLGRRGRRKAVEFSGSGPDGGAAAAGGPGRLVKPLRETPPDAEIRELRGLVSQDAGDRGGGRGGRGWLRDSFVVALSCIPGWPCWRQTGRMERLHASLLRVVVLYLVLVHMYIGNGLKKSTGSTILSSTICMVGGFEAS